MGFLFKGRRSDRSVHWSKDYVEHLRTVHFGLVALSAALVVLATSAKTYDSRAALQQIDDFIKMQTEWSPSWIARYKDGHRNARETEVDERELDISRCRQTGIKIENRSEYLQFPSSEWETSLFWSKDGNELRGYHSLGPIPDSVPELSLWWNQFQRPMIVVTPLFISDVATDPKGEKLKVSCESTVVKADHPGFGLTYSFGRPDGDVYGDNATFTFESGMNFEGPRPDKSPRYHVQVTHWSTSEIRGELPFACSFADLANAADGMSSLRLADVRQRIYDDIKKGADTFDAFGMKFPATQFTGWGITLVLATQLYVFFYLRQLAGKLHPNDAAWDVPWIGMDRSRLARIMLFATLVVAPLSAITLLCWRAAAGIILAWACRGWKWFSPITPFQILALAGLLLPVVASGFLAIRSWKLRPATSETDRPSMAFE
jgi:hypothetical protein